MKDGIILDDKAQEAIDAATNAAHTVEVVRQSQLDQASNNAAIKAADLAAENISNKIIDEQRMATIMREQMMNVLSQGTEKDRSIILARVPYICQEIKDINANIAWIVKLVIGAVILGGIALMFK